jgi:predicted Zn-dependent protease
LLVGAVCVGACVLPASGHGDLHERIEELSERLAATPNDVELLLRRGDLYRQHKDYAAALRDLDRVERLGGREADVLLLRGRTLLGCGCGRAGEGVGALERFVEIRPDHGEGWLLLARARRAVGRRDESVAAYGRAIALMGAPGPGVYLERAEEIRAGARAGGGASPEQVTDATRAALAGIDEGIARLGPVVTLELRAAELEVELGRPDAAVGRIDAVMAQAARKEAWLARKAEILENAGRTGEALAAYRAAGEAMDDGRGRDRSLREKVDCAIERLERAGAGEE